MEKKYGEPWQGGQDTVFCRYLHKYMIPLRPSVHCPHIGRTGKDGHSAVLGCGWSNTDHVLARQAEACVVRIAIFREFSHLRSSNP